MTAPEAFTTASKQPLTTGRRPDMIGIRAFLSSKRRLRMTPPPFRYPTRACEGQSSPAALPALQRLHQRLRLGRIPFGAALDSGHFAPILVDHQSHRQSERLAVLMQGLERIPARIQIAGE